MRLLIIAAATAALVYAGLPGAMEKCLERHSFDVCHHTLNR